MTGRTLATTCAIAVCAFGAGWLARSHASDAHATTAAPPAASADLPEAFWTEMETQRIMLRQLQDTCATRPAVAPPAPAPPPASAAKPSASAPPPPDDPVPMASAQALVDKAIADGQWTERDAMAMRAAMADMSPAQRDEAMHILLRALNERGVRSSTHGAPF